MAQFIYFPCTKSGNILKGFCPTIADGTSLLNDVSNYKKFVTKFKIKYYAFRPTKKNDDYSINPAEMTICELFPKK